MVDWLRGRRTESARDEGLAAGTGLITGDLTDRFKGVAGPGRVPCPSCGHPATVTDVIDLVERRTRHRCELCRHRWAVKGPVDPNPGGDSSE